MPLGSVTRRLLGFFAGRVLSVYYAPEYRLLLPGAARSGIDPRRADRALGFLQSMRRAPPIRIRSAQAIPVGDLARVHTQAYLGSLGERETLGSIFGLSPELVPVPSLWMALRIACGATLAAARESITGHGPVVNLWGGFSDAFSDHGHDHGALSDIAVALATLRAEGWSGQVTVLELNARSPLGLAECIQSDPEVQLVSLSSGSGPTLTRGVETVLLAHATDDEYLAQLDVLLSDLPRADLTFVVAGSDALREDTRAPLQLSLDGLRQRDIRTRNALGQRPSVWLSGHGASPDAWRALATTLLVLCGRESVPVFDSPEWLGQRLSRLGRGIPSARLMFDDDDVLRDLTPQRYRQRRWLDTYTREGVEYALVRYGIHYHLLGLGYQSLRVVLDGTAQGDRIRVFGQADGQESLLGEVVAERRSFNSSVWLYVHWLTLHHPRLVTTTEVLLPGQDVPGLGLAREIGELLVLAARRMRLQGIAFVPSHFHTAYFAKDRLRFADSDRQGRFEALLRDTAGLPLQDVARLLERGQVLKNGAVYRWEATLMLHRLEGEELDRGDVAAERERTRFTVAF